MPIGNRLVKTKDGGLRPIAVGLCLRCLASKIANRWAIAELLSTLAPHQLGVRVCGGAEAIVHAARAFVASASPLHALVKLDFSNAFNTVRRDCIFESVATHLPSLLSYVISSNESPSYLLHGSYTLHSAEGVQ